MSNTDDLQKARPEIIGGLSGVWGDDGYVNIAYFRSEDEARKGESAEPPEDMRAGMEEFQRLLGDVEFLDIHQPILL
jgi:hypothetical protein